MDKHNWSHVLVLFPDPSAAESTLSVEERLSNMETMLSASSEGQEGTRQTVESLSSRMDKLEHMVGEILHAIRKSSGGKRVRRKDVVSKAVELYEN